VSAFKKREGDKTEVKAVTPMGNNQPKKITQDSNAVVTANDT
jgi:hypothetical protein